jgi:hypothetical protein
MDHSHGFPKKSSGPVIVTESSGCVIGATFSRRALVEKSSGIAIVTALLVTLVLALNSVGQNVDPQTHPQAPAVDAQSQASPSPTPDDKAKAILRKVREAQEKELNEHGPQPPSSSSTGGFSMLAFIRAGWPLVVEYEIEEGATADLEMLTFNDRGFHYFKHRLEGDDLGAGSTITGSDPQNTVTLRRRKDTVAVPAEFGDLQPGTIGISAKMNTPHGSRKARFKLRGLGVGVHNLHALEKPRDRDEVESQSFNFRKTRFEMNFPTQGESLRDLDVTPEMIDTKQGQMAAYRFVPAETFGQWAADFSTVTYKMEDGIEVTKTKRIRTKEFRSEISGGSEARGDWDGKNSRGKFSKGPHLLAVRAWWSAASAGAGASCFRNADKLITVQ